MVEQLICSQQNRLDTLKRGGMMDIFLAVIIILLTILYVKIIDNNKITPLFKATLAQLAEQRFCKPQVYGSIP